jgi:excisionase family DNA binding protein
MKELTQEFYTIKEVMKLLRLSRLTIYRYITLEKLKAYKI